MRPGDEVCQVYCVTNNYYFFVSVNQPHPPNHRRPKSGQLSLEGEAERIPGIRGENGASGSEGPAGSERPTMPPAITIPTTDSLRQQNLNEFCRFRDDGPHSLPSICDVFIYCVHGIGSFEICKNGTKFNPEVLGCDHAVNFECAFSGIDRKLSKHIQVSTRRCFDVHL